LDRPAAVPSTCSMLVVTVEQEPSDPRLTFTPLTDPVRQLVYAERGASIGFVMVDGQPVMQDGRLTRIDEAAILSEIDTEYRTLSERFTEAEASVAPVLEAVERILRRCQQLPVADDTYSARLPAAGDPPVDA
jgi:5-methylthioadenosine/S-adenosylhomocysteine deaminase